MFAHDFTSITLVSVWICIALWSSLKDQDLEPKTKRWLLLKRQVQEEARTWGVAAFFLPFGRGADLLDWKIDEPIVCNLFFNNEISLCIAEALR